MKIVNRKNQVVGLMIICTCAANVVASVGDSIPNNIQDEIKKAISEKENSDVSKDRSAVLHLVNNGNKIYAEGSFGIRNGDSFKTRNNSENVKSNNQNDFHQIHKSGVKLDHVYHVAGNESDSSYANQTGDDDSPDKWKRKKFGRLLKLDDVAQANGTSSIKPRKGVNYYKDDADDSLLDDPPLNHSCFAADKNKCFDVGNYKDLNCSCCEMGNDLGLKIEQQPLVNCSTCSPVNEITRDAAKACKRICCQNNSSSENRQHIDVNRNGTTSKAHLTEYEIYENNTDLLNKSDSYSNVTRPVKKLKPSMTSVPYDLDNAKNLFSKSKGEKYVPKVISIFILPLVGILIYVLWKKTREFWDRRYYKRMDFLIDGIYND